MLTENIEKFVHISKNDLINIAYIRDPLRRKLSYEEKVYYYDQTVLFADAKALEVCSNHKSIEEAVKAYGGNLVEYDQKPVEDYAMFAYFEEPKTIAINSYVIAACIQFINDNKLDGLIGTADVRALVISHEFYHYLQFIDTEAYPRQKVYVRKNILGKSSKHRINALEEVAAMEFAKKYTGFKITPYVLNYLMLESIYPKQAIKLMKDYFDSSN